MTDLLLDANFLIALAYPKDRYHQRSVDFINQTHLHIAVPSIVLPEVIFNLRRVGGSIVSQRLGKIITGLHIPLIPLTIEDFERAMQVMEIYQTADLDFVDSCLTAIAERLNITKIATFDRRDFSIIRPRHIDYFELFP